MNSVMRTSSWAKAKGAADRISPQTSRRHLFLIKPLSVADVYSGIRPLLTKARAIWQSFLCGMCGIVQDAGCSNSLAMPSKRAWLHGYIVTRLQWLHG